MKKEIKMDFIGLVFLQMTLTGILGFVAFFYYEEVEVMILPALSIAIAKIFFISDFFMKINKLLKNSGNS